jgi:hypothetical protein
VDLAKHANKDVAEKDLVDISVKKLATATQYVH